jgi:hypothetical protein
MINIEEKIPVCNVLTANTGTLFSLLDEACAFNGTTLSC